LAAFDLLELTIVREGSIARTLFRIT